ncbi:MAG: hypothetical protein ACFFAE_15230 [Candidatus Hodarchaeota archaeon]
MNQKHSYHIGFISDIQLRYTFVYGLLLSLNILIVLLTTKDYSRLFPTNKRLVYIIIIITLTITAILYLILSVYQLALLESLIIPLWYMTNIGNFIIISLFLFGAYISSAVRFKEYEDKSTTELPEHIKKVFTKYDFTDA